MLRLFSIFICIFLCFPAFAQEKLTITKVLSSQTVQLSDGRVVFLGGVLPEADAKEYLIKTYQNKAIQPISDDSISNRYDEVVAHIETIDGKWIQSDLIEKGLAVAFTMPSFRERQKELLILEGQSAVVLKANPPVDKSIKGFQTVEGMIVDAVERGKYVYLNFGDDWKTDFTVSLTRADHKKFITEQFNVHDLKGKRVRVRGWLDHYNGPFIKITYPEQIEVL